MNGYKFRTASEREAFLIKNLVTSRLPLIPFLSTWLVGNLSDAEVISVNLITSKIHLVNRTALIGLSVPPLMKVSVTGYYVGGHSSVAQQMF